VDEAHCPDIPGGCLRVAIGEHDKNQRMLAAVDRLKLVD
jgi:histidinol-phosphate/aromatic aminotransferase/cobyric acid decarboxylase-like protein